MRQSSSRNQAEFMTLLQGSLLFGSAVVAGMINSVAGGGTLLTFPSLVWAGFSPVVANATSTLALVPGAWSSLWGYRQEVGRNRRVIGLLAIPSFIGGLIGALLLYEAARHGGRPFADRFVKFAHLDPAKLDEAEAWFKRRGWL